MISIFSALLLGLSLIAPSSFGAGASCPNCVTCSTNSEDVKFFFGDRNPEIAKAVVINTCIEDSRTHNEECRANATCENRMPPPKFQCKTKSNDISFERMGNDQNVLITLIVAACMNEPATDNIECRANAECSFVNPPANSPAPALQSSPKAQ